MRRLTVLAVYVFCAVGVAAASAQDTDMERPCQVSVLSQYARPLFFFA